MRMLLLIVVMALAGWWDPPVYARGGIGLGLARVRVFGKGGAR